MEWTGELGGLTPTPFNLNPGVLIYHSIKANKVYPPKHRLGSHSQFGGNRKLLMNCVSLCLLVFCTLYSVRRIFNWFIESCYTCSTLMVLKLWRLPPCFGMLKTSRLTCKNLRTASIPGEIATTHYSRAAEWVDFPVAPPLGLARV